MPRLRAGVSHGESADDSGLCSSDRDSECGDGIAQGKTYRSQSHGAQDGNLLVTTSSPTELASKVVAQDDTDELDRTLEDQDERRRADERRTSNALGH